MSRARLQLWCTAIDAVTVDEITPPRLPTVFIRAESEAEYPGARSMQAAQKFAAANMVKPAANAIIGKATTVRLRWLPVYNSSAATPMPTHTAASRPFLRSEKRATRSENHPPTGDNTAIARKGDEVHAAACMRSSPRTFTA
jgi:hypothetical protein